MISRTSADLARARGSVSPPRFASPRTPGAGAAARLRRFVRCGLVSLVLGLALPGMSAVEMAPGLNEYTLRTWRQVQGLPQSSITALAQDARGFLWVGTQKGLARFDGVRFHVFTRDTAPALADNWITALLASKQTGDVWIGTLGGVCVYRQGSFRAVALPAESRNRIRELTELPGGRILVGAEGAFVISDGRVERVESLGGEPITASLVAAGRIWLAGGKLFELDDALAVRRTILLPPERAGSLIDGLAADGDCVWLGTDHGLLRLDGHDLQPSPWPRLANAPVRAVTRDRHGALWVATGTELVRVRPGGEPEQSADSAAPRQVRRILEDRDGSIWAGSIGFGLTQLRLGRVSYFGARPGSNSATTWSIAHAEDGLWLGTVDAVARLRAGRVEPVVSTARLPHWQIWSLFDDGRTLSIGTRTGLARYDLRADVLLPVPAELRGVGVYDIVPQPPDALLVATGRGLFLYEPGSGRVARVDASHRDISFAILAEGSGCSYLATDAGVLELGPAGSRRIEEVGRHPINALVRARDGSLLVGSEDGGLFRQQAGRWSQFDRRRGLPVDTVYALVSDGGEGVFVVHHQGVYRLSLSDLEAATTNPSRRLSPEILLDSNPDRGGESAECCAGIGRHAALLHSNALWLTGWGGLLRLALEPRSETAPWPRPMIERVRVGGKWTEEPIGPVSVPATDRDVTVEFTAPVLAQPGAVRFRYRLESRGAEWRLLEPTAPRAARFTDLPPGRHHFKVETLVPGQVALETLAPGQATALGGTDLILDVEPRFRETFWFYLLITGVAGVGLVAVHKARVHSLKSRQKYLEQTVHERTQDLHRANEALQDLTVRDDLTGLRNRRFLEQVISGDVAYLERLRSSEPTQDLVLGFFMVDIDHFKRINDQEGHATGDLALKAFADRLRRRVRQGDYVIRWGGEEFLVVVRGVRRSDLESMATLILADVRGGPVETPAGALSLTCSIGFFGHPCPRGAVAGTWEHAVRIADAALYEAKRAGRDRWATYRLRGVGDVGGADEEDRLRATLESADLVLSDSPLGAADDRKRLD